VVHGCVNRTGEGGFVGDICVPCRLMITTGRITPSFNFIYRLAQDVIQVHVEQINVVFVCNEEGDETI
jgi:hypothetical protein